MSARSFCTTTSQPETLARTLKDTRNAVPAASGGLVFVSGALIQQLPAIASKVRAAWKGIPTCIVPAAGVLHERSEIEGNSAASGLLWSGGQVVPLALEDDRREPDRALGNALGPVLGDRCGAVVLFYRPDSFEPQLLEGLSAAAPNSCVFGAGAVGGAGIALTAAGDTLEGRAVGLVVTGMAPPIVDASPACRLLSELMPIDEASGGMVLRIGGRPALDVLAACAPGIMERSGGTTAQALVLAALGDGTAGEDGRERYVLRPLRGIDPARRAIAIGPEARPGTRFAFAVRDAAAAKLELETTARAVSKHALGAAPRFAIYLSCAGRGQALYNAADVEVRILRQRFGDLPIAGMHSSFEIAPSAPGRARLSFHTAVLALFRSPS
jgi:small ligand-binding sensory domain FIST